MTALSGAAIEALRGKNPAAARPLFERLVQTMPRDGNAWIGLALACRDLGDGEGHLGALDQVLALDPNNLPALLMKADHFAALGDGRAAGAFYRAVVNRAPALKTLSEELRREVRRAHEQAARYALAYETHLRDALSKVGFDSRSSSPRFSQSLDLLLGKKQVYFQSPSSFYFPELPQRQFYERADFAWLASFESKAPLIRDELLEVIRADRGLRPYVRTNANRPPKEFGDLLDNLSWSAFFLIEDGAAIADAAARCPRTMQALSAVPLAEVPGRTPSVLFSLLRPRTRIPAHTGQINARLICHLPLIVPAGCRFRVGNEVREWVEGETLIFDDTIEHEAWNDSEHLRAVLLFDIWRPELTLDERKLVAATLAAVDSYGAVPSA